MKISKKNKMLILCSTLGIFTSLSTQAASVSYLLDQSNIDSVMPDGQAYATVTIEDGLTFGSDTNAVKFIVNVFSSTFSTNGVSKGNNFGIRDFGFNLSNGAPTVLDNNIIGPAGWSGNIVPPNNQLDGFGRFFGDIKGTGTNRFDPLVFWITGVTGDSIASYAAASTNGNGGPAPQGNAWFAVNIGDFSIMNSTINSGYFAGGNGLTPPTTPVPLPGTIWLMMSALVGSFYSFRRKRL